MHGKVLLGVAPCTERIYYGWVHAQKESIMGRPIIYRYIEWTTLKKGRNDIDNCGCRVELNFPTVDLMIARAKMTDEEIHELVSNNPSLLVDPVSKLF